MRGAAFPVDAYLEHLSDRDVTLLAGPAARRPGEARALLSIPEALAHALAARRLFETVFANAGADSLLAASPFLVFAVAVEHAGRELGRMTYYSEWLGPHRRAAVFGAASLSEFLAQPQRRLFLAALLASYTRVASGSVIVRTARGLRRQRFSELDPVRLAHLLELAPEPERAGVLRRLGDLALFLTGVFPDQVARRGFGSVEEQRLRRSAGGAPGALALDAPAGAVGAAGAVGLLEALGARSYRTAAGRLAPSATAAELTDMADNFADARRILNWLTEHVILTQRASLFGEQGG